MEHSGDGETEVHRQQLIDLVKRLEKKTTRLSRYILKLHRCYDLLTTHCSQSSESSTFLSLIKASTVRSLTANDSSTYSDLVPQLSQSTSLALMVGISGTSLIQISTLPKNFSQTRPRMYTLASQKPWQKWLASRPSPLATPETSNWPRRLPEPQERKNYI